MKRRNGPTGAKGKKWLFDRMDQMKYRQGDDSGENRHQRTLWFDV